jgi:hypothetical protein
MRPLGSLYSIRLNVSCVRHWDLCGAFAILLVSQVAAAQESKLLANRPANWRLLNLLLQFEAKEIFTLTPAQHTALAAKVDTLVSILGGTPVFNSPVRFCVVASTIYDFPPSLCDRQNCTALPPIAAFKIYFYDTAAGSGGLATPDNAIPVEVHVRINDLEHAVRGEYHLAGAQTSDGCWIVFMPPPEKSRTEGLVVYDNTWLVLAKPGRLPWVPVSREEFIAASVHASELQITQEAILEHRRNPKVSEQAYQAAQMNADPRVQSLRAELARMSPAERASPAWDAHPAGKTDSGPVPPGVPNAHQLASTNPTYFDSPLPRSAIQLISVDVKWRTKMQVDWAHAGESSDPAIRGAHAFLTTADWKRVAALVQ